MTSESVRTDDGSLTRRHPVSGELYHARDGARGETRAKYIQPARLAERLRAGAVHILDVGFGIGITCMECLALPAPHGIRIDTLELEPEVFKLAKDYHPPHPVFEALAHQGFWEANGQRVTAHPGDLRQTLPKVGGGIDLVFHDPFQPLCNSEAWTVEVFRMISEKMNSGGLLLTYSQSRIIRAGLVEAGLSVGDTPAVPPHRGGTAAAKDPERLTHPLPLPPGGWGEPFRDPGLKRTPNEIRSCREAAVRA